MPEDVGVGASAGEGDADAASWLRSRRRLAHRRRLDEAAEAH